MDRQEIIFKLREIGELKAGDLMPDWMGINWGNTLSKLCRAAATELESSYTINTIKRR